eukprot:m.22530 g.22530  ORF g.22530 m.22530 type:complete len:110 (+) comp10760_c0_seq1:223-552(+)
MHHNLTLPHRVLSTRISRERYMTEEIIMLISALGLFAGGTITIYLYLNDDIQDRVLAPSIKLLLQSINFFVILGAMLLITNEHMEKSLRVVRLQDAIAFNAREKPVKRR